MTWVCASKALDRPKSVILTSASGLSSVISKFSGFRSRWAMFLSCKYLRAAAAHGVLGDVLTADEGQTCALDGAEKLGGHPDSVRFREVTFVHDAIEEFASLHAAAA